MNCEEFLSQFRDALDGKVSENVIQDNVNYYRSYINSQIACGKNETDVLRMLGDPRLLAKTIEESSKFASKSRESNEYTGDYENFSSAKSTHYTYTDTEREKHKKLPGWITACIVIMIIFLVLSVVFQLFVFLAPFIIVFLLAVFVIRRVSSWWQNRWRK